MPVSQEAEKLARAYQKESLRRAEQNYAEAAGSGDAERERVAFADLQRARTAINAKSTS